MDIRWVIYMLRNMITGEEYIGQTKDLKKRLDEHKKLRSGCRRIRNAIQKYGLENFEVIILHDNVLNKDRNWLEKQCIWIYNTLSPNGYNLREGGSPGLASEETKQKQREIALAQDRSGPNNGMYGRQHKEESKQKTSKSLKGRYIKKYIWDKKDNIINEYQSGMTYKDLAKKYDCSIALIGRVLRGHNNGARRFLRPDVREHDHQICAEYKSGISLGKIAKKYNCSHITIRNILLEYNMELRSR